MRMKDKELGKKKIQNIKIVGGMLSIVGGTLLAAIFLGNQ